MRERKTYRRRTGRRMGVLDPARKQEFLSNSKEILGGELIYSSQIEGHGDFMERVKDVNVYFDRLGIVSLVGAPKDSAKQFFTDIVFEEIRPSAGGTPIEANSLAGSQQCLQDDGASSWGLKATLPNATTATGANVRVAILDSGLDFDHEAFRGRADSFGRASFVDDPVEHDDFGHGTACASVICGQPEKSTGSRIGVAPNVDLSVAKIFDIDEESPDTRTLAAINWALASGCKIISMSIGELVTPDDVPDPVFEAVAKAALDNENALLVAGAGNNSTRSNNDFKAVNHPGNCPSVLAVGAIDNCFKMADFSNRELPPKGGEVNLVAPGLSVRMANAYAVQLIYKPRDGTSFAVPFVSGIAALWMESANLSGAALWLKLKNSAKPLNGLAQSDRGWGLVQGP